MCHINKPIKKSKVGFVFICPGRFEEAKKKPCSGQTGTNLQDALGFLSKNKNNIFHSTDRYDYLITNSWDTIEYKAKTNRSTPDFVEVLDRENIIRLFNEIKELSFVVACGVHAHIAVKACQEFLGFNGKVVNVKHTSSQALGCPTAEERNSRIEEWANSVCKML